MEPITRRISLLCFLITIFPFSNLYAQSGWQRQASGTTTALNGVFFTDAENGTAVGQNAISIRTANGGLNWHLTVIDTSQYLPLKSITYASPTLGVAVGLHGIICRTTDAGMSWSIQVAGGNQTLYGVSTGSLTNWMAVGFGRVSTSTDGGLSWSTKTTPTFNNINTAYSFTDQTSIVGAVNGILAKTTDHGENWSIKQSGSTQGIYGISFANSLVGVAVGNSGLIVRTTDGGENWVQITTGISSSLYSVSFAGSDTGIVVGSAGAIHRTSDAGLTWQQQSSGTTAILRSVHMVSGSIGTIVGDSGIVLRTTTSGVVSVKNPEPREPLQFELFQNYPNPFNPITQISFIIPLSGMTTLRVFDIRGNEVATLVHQHLERGTYTFEFKAANLASGIYFSRLKSGSQSITKKMVLVK